MPHASSPQSLLPCCAWLLSACGFQLRGQASLPFDSLYVVGPAACSPSQIARAVRAGSQTRITDNPKDAQVTLEILAEQRERAILSLSSGGRVREITLTYRVTYRLYDQKKKRIHARRARSCCGAICRIPIPTSSPKSRKKPCFIATCRTTPCSSWCAACRPRASIRSSTEALRLTRSAMPGFTRPSTDLRMRISTEQLPQHLKRALAPLYTVFGDEPLLALEATDRIRARARSERLQRARSAHCRTAFRLVATAGSAGSRNRCSPRAASSNCASRAASPATRAARRCRISAAGCPRDTITLICLPRNRLARAERRHGSERSTPPASWSKRSRSSATALPAWLAGRLKTQEQHADDADAGIHRRQSRRQPACGLSGSAEARAAVPAGRTVVRAGQGGGARRRALRRVRPGRDRALGRRAAAGAHARRPARRRRRAAARAVGDHRGNPRARPGAGRT